MAGRADYEERKQARIDRLNNKAYSASKEANTQYKRSHDLVDGIPLGQPNIEGRTALPRLREKSRAAMERGVEASEKAEYYSDRAEAAENNNAISSDDPNCIEKLQSKIDSLKKQQEFAKSLNRYFKKNGDCKGFPDLLDEEAAEFDRKIEKAWSWEKKPFASYELTSINQRIKSAEERIKKIQSVEAMPAEIVKFDGGKIISDADDNRIKIVFDERQDEETINQLKRNGFNWSRYGQCWQRLRNQNALYAAKKICGVEAVKQ